MSIRKILEDWQKESDEIHNNEFEILEEPKNGETKVNVLHKKCGNILTTTLRNHINRYCKYCSKKNIKSLEEFQLESDRIHNNEFEILEEPKNGKTSVEILHKKCGSILRMTMNNHINHKNGCKKCSKYSIKSSEHWIERTKDIWGDEYELLQDVTNVHEKINIRHNFCGNILSKSMNSFIHNKRGCLVCSKKTYGEDYIENYFKLNKIEFETQKSFDGLVNPKTGRKLKLDFYIKDLKIAIEVDGVQHYKPIKHWGGDESFESQKYRDGLKDEYFKNSEISLIRINNKNVKNINEIICQLKQKP